MPVSGPSRGSMVSFATSPEHDATASPRPSGKDKKRATISFSPEAENSPRETETPKMEKPKRHSIGFSPEIHEEMAARLKERRKTIELAELQEAAAKLAEAPESRCESWLDGLEEPLADGNDDSVPISQSYLHTTREEPMASEWGCHIDDGTQEVKVPMRSYGSFFGGEAHSSSSRGRRPSEQASHASHQQRPSARSASPASRSPPTDSEPLPGYRDSSPGHEPSARRGGGSARSKVLQRSSSSSPRSSKGRLPPQSWLHESAGQSWLHEEILELPRGNGEDADNQFAAIQFARWASGRWEQLHDLFTMDNRLTNVVQRCNVTEAEFARYCQRYGFDGDSHRVFHEIAAHEGKGRICDAWDSVNSDTTKSIRLPQFLRFQRYAMALAAPVVESDVEGFASSLRQQGTLLRAWRVELDRHGKGWVTFEDLAHACRKLGCTGEARHIWSALRSDGDTTPLKLCDFAPEEANNLEQYTEMLWHIFGFDLDKAWAQMDVKKRGAVTLDEFARGARQFFDGNARLIFRGLDATGLGRLRRADFNYLQAFLPTGSSALNAVTHATPPIRALGAWVQEELGGPEVFVVKLGLSPESKKDPTMSVKEFATALHELGYPGDTLEAAKAAARGGDGAQISGSMLLNLLTGRPPRHGAEGSEHSDSPSSQRVTPHSAASSAGPFRKALWNSSVDNFSMLNESRHKGGRAYFTTGEHRRQMQGQLSSSRDPTESQKKLPTSSSSRDLAVKKKPLKPKAQWNDSVTDFSQHGEKNSRYTKTYFSVPDRVEKGPPSADGAAKGVERTARRRRPGADSFCEMTAPQAPSFTTPVRRRPGRDSFSEELAVPLVDTPAPSAVLPANAGRRTRRRPGGDSFSEEMLAGMPTTAALLANVANAESASSPSSSPSAVPAKAKGGSSPPSPSAAPRLVAHSEFVPLSMPPSPSAAPRPAAKSRSSAKLPSAAAARSPKAKGAVGSSRKAAPFSSASKKYNAPSLAEFSKRRTMPGEDSGEEAS